MSNLRQSPHSLRSSPSFTITAVLILSLGIGLSTAMFSFIEISASHPRFYAGAAGVLALAALLACFMPAWRAARADPRVVLRAER